MIIVDKEGKTVDLNELIDRLRKDEPHRFLANDEVGLVVYVGDLQLYSLKPTPDGEFLAEALKEISRPRFPLTVIRRQIGAAMISVTADKVFLVKDDKALKKVRAEKLKPGMVLATGEKIYQ